jgi:RNA polymerase sigma factor (sigma-70 family)
VSSTAWRVVSIWQRYSANGLDFGGTLLTSEMKDAEQDPRLAALASEMAWLRRLARALLRNDEAADLAQDAWLVAVDQAPTDGRPLRPWLSRVALNLARMRGRSRHRREAREEKLASLSEPITTPDELVQKVQIQRLVADEVLRLTEPYRSTVLLHYFEELSCAEIARRLELPEGTVRRRLKVALDELRARLDADRDNGGGLAALIPLAGIPAAPTQTASVAVGVLAMKKVLVAIVVLVAILAGFLWKSHGHDTATPSAAGTTGSPIDLINRAAVRAAQPDLPAWLTQRDAKPRHVAGRVMFGGVPVAGATVELASIASEMGLIPAPHSTTNTAGEFDFGPQPPMEVSVRASAPGKSGTAIDLDLRNPYANTDHLVIELGGCGAMLMGTVRDASGGTIAKARITRLPFEAPSPVPGGNSIVTDESGHYELCVETRWPGWVSIEVSAQGYGSIVFTSIVPGRVKVDFALLPEATIVGRVVRDDNRAPVAQAYVFLPPGPRGLQTTASRGTFTDGTGRFKIDRVAPGPHLVFARADGMAESRGTPVAVEAGQTTAEIEIRLETASTIRGVVVDHEHKPVVGARVATAAVDGGHASVAVSQEDGSFALTEVPRGTVRFTAFPYDVVTPQTFLANQPVHEGVVIEVASLGTIVGHVTHATKPVPGASISIQGPNDRELEPIHADADGRFEARGLRSGPWTLYASNDHEGSFGGPSTVHVSNGETAEVTIDITYSAAISGRVVDQNGEPVPGVTAAFHNTNSDDGGQGVTSIDGTFRAPSLTGGGEYRPTVTLNLFSTTKLRPVSGDDFPLVTVTDRDSEVTGVLLTVQLDHLTIAGKVVDKDGAPMPDVRVVAELTQPGTQPAFFRGRQDPAATTDMDGHFSIGDLVDGAYALQARTTAGDEATVTDVTAGRNDVTIVLPVAGSIEGSLVGFKDSPEVSATRNGGMGAPVIGVVDGAGFTVRGLSPGSYLLTGRTAAEAASVVVEVVSGRTSHATLTSHGSGVITGHVRDFRSGAPIEGMTCGVIPRVGISPGKGNPNDGVRTDPQGAFSISSAPAGDIVVYCNGLWRLYSDGLRMIALQASQSSDVDVPVVAWADTTHTVAGFGAGFDYQVLVPRFIGVRPGGAAASAGFQDGDVIISVDGASVTNLSPTGVWILISNRPPGSKVKLGVTRAGKTVNGELTLGEA